MARRTSGRASSSLRGRRVQVRVERRRLQHQATQYRLMPGLRVVGDLLECVGQDQSIVSVTCPRRNIGTAQRRHG